MTRSLTATTPDSLTAVQNPLTLSVPLDTFARDRRALGGWLRTFDDVERSSIVARQSYWHFNGFAKLVIQAGHGYKVRLHVWPAGEHRLGERNPHGHRWNFASTVLCGEGLRDVHYTVSDSGAEYEEYEYVGGNVVGALTHVRTVRLTETASRVLRAGDQYVLDTSVVHTVEPLGATLIATLVVQGPACRASAPVFGVPGVDVDEPGRAISADEVRELIGDVLTALV